MEKFSKQSGQITIPIMTAIAVGQIVVGGVTGYYTSQVAAQEKINIVQQKFSEANASLSERTVKLETIVPTIQKDTSEIKDSLKNIERAFRITP